MTMTKADIVERIYEKVGFSKKEATEVVESIFELVKERLEQGEKVKISGFGNFVVNEKRPRKGRNPQTGEEIVISGRRVLTFKASQVLKKTMNGRGPRRAGRSLPHAGRLTTRRSRTAKPRAAFPLVRRRRRSKRSSRRARARHDVQGGKGRRGGDLRSSRARPQLRGDVTRPRRAW